MKTSIVAAFCAVIFAVPVSAQTGGDDASKPIKPGGVRITTKAPEPDKWDGQRPANGMVRVFKCKPLAGRKTIRSRAKVETGFPKRSYSNKKLERGADPTITRSALGKVRDEIGSACFSRHQS